MHTSFSLLNGHLWSFVVKFTFPIAAAVVHVCGSQIGRLSAHVHKEYRAKVGC